MAYVVMQKGKTAIRRGLFLRPLSILVITSMVILLAIVDVCCTLYHAIYFRLNGIPLIPRREYIVIDRNRLTKLNWIQRWNCVYCDYANGLMAWAKAIVNMTEAYGCAIKHASKAPGQEHQKDFYEYERFR